MVKTVKFLNSKNRNFCMINAVAQKKFVDEFVNSIFRKDEERPQIYSQETPELKARLRFLCYLGLKQAHVDFWEYDQKRMETTVKYTKTGVIDHQRWSERQPEHVRRYGFLRYGGTINNRVKEKLTNDSLLKTYAKQPTTLPKTLPDSYYFGEDCDTIALLFDAQYLAKIRAEEEPEKEM